MLGEKSVVKTLQLTAVRPGWVTSNEVNGSSLPTSFPPCVCMRNQPHFAAQHNVTKDNAKNLALFFFFFRSRDDSSEPVSFAVCEPVDNRSHTQEVNQPARNQRVPASLRSNRAPVRNGEKW